MKTNNYKSERAPDAAADLYTDLGQMQNAFIRRGLACEQAGLLSYATHEKSQERFHDSHDEAPPGGFKAPDIAAVLRADKEQWMKNI